jgi:hypothetical protein
MTSRPPGGNWEIEFGEDVLYPSPKPTKGVPIVERVTWSIRGLTRVSRGRIVGFIEVVAAVGGQSRWLAVA